MVLLKSGDTFAGCRILSLCGSGGMGVVYLAEDVLHRKVALKIVAIGDAERELRGIQQYIRVAENIPGMIHIHHAGIEADQLYYIMEAADPLTPDASVYVPKTLAVLLKQKGVLPPHYALEIIRFLADSLRQFHEAHLIHRDIKPENIIFVNNSPKLCDPGLVCIQDSTVSFSGTLGYLPPECFNGENLNSPDRDLYALGMVFYVAVTGEVPSRYPRMPLSLHVAAQKKLWPLIVRVCNSNPQRRFASASAFLAALPAEIPEPNWLDRISEALREYRLLHPRFVFKLTSILLIFLLCGALLTAHQIHNRRKRAAYMEQCRNKCLLAEKKLKKETDNLNTQLEACSGITAAQKFSKALSSLSENPETRLSQLHAVEQQLKELALKMIPKIPAKTDDEQAELLSSQIRNLLNSPLGNRLPQKKREEITKRTKKLEQRHITKRSRLWVENKFLPGNDYSHGYVYIPAGVYRDKQGKIVHIKHAFWCGDSEISTYLFSNESGAQWLLSNKELPQVKFAWNDLIDFCRSLTIQYHQKGVLPDGYIFRPLTPQEWFWAYRNAWKGMRKNPPAAIAHKRAQPVYTGTPNELGLYHMEGNVSEITLSDETEKMGNCVHLCGNSYLTPGTDPRKIRYLKYQHLPPFVGSRIAVARGKMTFFDRAHWYIEDRPLFLKDKVYQCIAVNRLLFEKQDAAALCELLGGRLCAPDEPELRKKMREFFWESDSFPIAVDAIIKNGKLITASGKPYLHVSTPAPPAKPELVLNFYRGTVRYCSEVKSCGFLCEWTKDEYAKRTNLTRILKSRAIAHTFQSDRKLYALVLAPSIIYPVRQIALILGAKLAEPRTPELREKIKKELAPWKDKPIFLGGYWKFDRWIFPDGTELKMELPAKAFLLSNSFNAAAPGLLEGKFYALQSTQGFLLEFPLP